MITNADIQKTNVYLFLKQIIAEGLRGMKDENLRLVEKAETKSSEKIHVVSRPLLFKKRSCRNYKEEKKKYLLADGRRKRNSEM